MSEVTIVGLLRRSIPNGKTGCWEWARCTQANGYGRVRAKGKTYYAHRLAYELIKGPVPAGMDVCHRCDNRRCCNPSHLFAGTRQDNMDDAVSKGRQAKGPALPQTKLSDRDARQIAERAESGERYESIAKDFGVCRQRAGQIALQQGIRRHGRSQ